MDYHQAIAICVVISLAFVIDSTIKLYKYRAKNEVDHIRGPLRDIAIVRRPAAFPLEESRLVIRNWLSCFAFLGLLVAFYFASPDDVGPSSALTPPAPSSQSDVSDAPATAQ